MNFKNYVENQNQSVKRFLNELESNKFKVIWIDDRNIVEKNPAKDLDLANFRGSIIYANNQALIVTETGANKLLSQARVEELKQKFLL